MSDKLMRLAPKRPELGTDLPGDRIERLIHFARLAPSTHNSQPWKFTADGGVVNLFADFSRWLKAADPERRELYLSLGCALETLLIAGDYEGLGVDLRYFPVPSDDAHICRAKFGAGAAKRENSAARLLLAVPKRHTSHRLFDKARRIDAHELQLFSEAADGEYAAFHLLRTEQERGDLLALLTEVESELFHDKAYRADLVRWAGSGASGTDWLKAKLAQYKVEHAASAKLVQGDADLLASSPVIAILSTARQDRLHEVLAGQAYARAVLFAENQGLRSQPFSAFTATEHARTTVARIANLGPRHPQLVVRLGAAESESARAPRRALGEVMVKGS